MFRTLTLALLVMPSLLAASPAHASAACDPFGPNAGLFTLDTPAGRYYLEDRGLVMALARDFAGQAGDVTRGGVCLYEESNGVADLQRGGYAQPYLIGLRDACADVPLSLPGPDTLIDCVACDSVD